MYITYAYHNVRKNWKKKTCTSHSCEASSPVISGTTALPFLMPRKEKTQDH